MGAISAREPEGNQGQRQERGIRDRPGESLDKLLNLLKCVLFALGQHNYYGKF